MEAWALAAGLIVPFLGLAIACIPQTAKEYQEMKDWIHSWDWDTPDWDSEP